MVLHSFICHLRGRSPENPTLSLKKAKPEEYGFAVLNAVKKLTHSVILRAEPEESFVDRHKILRHRSG
jgi:hypothetical protein